MKSPLTPNDDSPLSESKNPMDWLLYLGGLLKAHKWIEAFGAIVQLDVFDETTMGSLSHSIDEDWTEAVEKVILGEKNARLRLIERANRDIFVHNQWDLFAQTFRSQNLPVSTELRDRWMSDRRGVCAERAYAVRLKDWLRGIGKPPDFKVEMKANEIVLHHGGKTKVIPGTTMVLADFPFPFPIYLIFVGYDGEGASVIGVGKSETHAKGLLEDWIKGKKDKGFSYGDSSFIKEVSDFGMIQDFTGANYGRTVYEKFH